MAEEHKQRVEGGERDDEPERVDFKPPATWGSDLRVLGAIFNASISGETQQDRLEAFYEKQADVYDLYRHRMLHGRLGMVRAMPAPRGGTWVDLGGGTGSNLQFFGANLNHWGKVVVLDLCPSLLEQARKRVEENGWTEFVDVVLGDATDGSVEGLPAPGTVDVVTFSYALTMIPDWRAAIKNAWSMLKVGGSIAVADFTVHESQWPGMGPLWKWIFAHDTVYLSEEHMPALESVFDTTHKEVGYGGFPFVPPLLKACYYEYVGVKRSEEWPGLPAAA